MITCDGRFRLLILSCHISTIAHFDAVPFILEGIKTTSMGNVNTGVLEKNKEHYLRSKDKAEK